MAIAPEPRPLARVTITVETPGEPTQTVVIPVAEALDFGVKYEQPEWDLSEWWLPPVPPAAARFEFSCKPHQDEEGNRVYVTMPKTEELETR